MAHIAEPHAICGAPHTACFGAFMSSLGVEGNTQFWEVHDYDQQFEENETTEIGKSQSLRRECNVRINEVSTRGSGIAKILKKVLISRYLDSSATDLHIAQNTCGIDYADTW